MPKLGIVGAIDVAPGRRDQLFPLLKARRARCLKMILKSPRSSKPCSLATTIQKFSCTNRTETPPPLTNTRTGHPSHGFDKKLLAWV
jgi:hypothetical protein